MEYITRMVRSTEGLSQEDALTSLQSHPSFKSGTKIASVYNQGGRWVAKLLEPKTAAEFEDITETPEELHEEKHENPFDGHEELESPLEELEEHEDENSEDTKIAELEKKIDLLLEALGISEDGEDLDSLDDLEGPEEPMADLPPVPEKHDPENHSGSGSGAKLKPGEVPNRPGVTPVGSPSFASVRQSGPSTPPPAATSAPMDASTSAPVGSVDENETSRQDQLSQQRDPSSSTPAGAAGSPTPVVSFTASKLDPNREMTIRQAKASLENHYNGFRVARIKRDGDYIHALVSR